MRDIVADVFMIFMSVDVKAINCVEEFITKVPIDNQDLSPPSYKIPREKHIERYLPKRTNQNAGNI